MNRMTAFGRKLIYLVILLAMLVPLYLLGQPSAGSGDPGGRLSEMRGEFNIAESDLGEISPASETMKLASLGLRGVAATLLWNKAHRYRVLHEWDRLKAALNNIALLQPHFDKVWEHQAHNLAYNVSIEFDDYRQRYEMVREGTEFLTRGVRQNRNAPRLIWYTGWFYGQKMGMSDEKIQFRKLFADDEVLHESLMDEGIAVDSPEARGPLGKPDNWLVGRLWLNHGYELVDGGVRIRRQTPLNFFETGPKWRIKHAEAVESEGILDFRAQNAWDRASEDWSEFGDRSIPTTAAFTIKLGHIEDLKRQRIERMDNFKELTAPTYQAAVAKLMEDLPIDLQQVADQPESERSEAGKRALRAIERKVDLQQVAKESDESVRLRAIGLLTEMADLDQRIQKTDGYRTQINYEYWRTLCLAEREKRTVEARRLVYEAEEANAQAELDKAIQLYEQAFAIWAEIFDDYPLLTIDDSAEDLFESIRRYMVAIDSQELPDGFPLSAFVEMRGREGDQLSSVRYEEIRNAQKVKAEQRRKELEAEERRREEEAAKLEAAKKKEAEQPESADTESADEKPADEKPADEKPKVEDKSQEQPDQATAEKKDAAADAPPGDNADAAKDSESSDQDSPPPADRDE